MPRLCTDFDRNGGTFMILRGQEMIQSDDINHVQRSMLASVNIPNLLKLDVREVDFEVSLHYEITGKRMLSQCLKNDKLSMNEFYNLLLQVADVLDQCKQYMLSSSNYLLDDNYIYVDEPLGSGSLYFTYVPFMKNYASEPLGKSLVGLITKMMTSVTEIEGNGLQRILKFCCDELFSVPEFKNMLLEMLAGKETAMESPRSSQNPSVYPSLHHPLSGVTIKEYIDTPQGFAEGASAEYVKVYDEEIQVEKERSAPKSTYLLLAFILIDALVWKFLYFDQPNLSIYISLGLTIVLIVVFFVVRSGAGEMFGSISDRLSGIFRKSSSSSKFEGEDWGTHAEKDSRELSKNWRWNEHSSVSSLESKRDIHWDEIKQEVYQPQAISQFRQFESNSEEIPDDIYMPPPPMQTVLLDQSISSSQEPTAIISYCLERHGSNNERSEWIQLHFGSFVIGRSKEIVQYAETTVGVSRAHLELMITKEGCTIKDLGSRNGTKLDGEEIAPYKEYPLAVGDTFTIAEQDYTLRMN
ncbi:FHA domain protein [compost metagenome]